MLERDERESEGVEGCPEEKPSESGIGEASSDPQQGERGSMFMAVSPFSSVHVAERNRSGPERPPITRSGGQPGG